MPLGHSITAPAWLHGCPVVAVVRLVSGPGEVPNKIVAVTRDGEKFNVHYAVSPDNGETWDAYHGNYDVSWERAWAVMAERVERHGLA